MLNKHRSFAHAKKDYSLHNIRELTEENTHANAHVGNIDAGVQRISISTTETVDHVTSHSSSKTKTIQHK
jgi:hypothetical protein